MVQFLLSRKPQDRANGHLLVILLSLLSVLFLDNLQFSLILSIPWMAQPCFRWQKYRSWLCIWCNPYTRRNPPCSLLTRLLPGLQLSDLHNAGLKCNASWHIKLLPGLQLSDLHNAGLKCNASWHIKLPPGPQLSEMHSAGLKGSA